MRFSKTHHRLTASVLAAALACGGALTAAGPATAADPAAGPQGYTSTDRGDGTYTVPILNSDVPDVSVERVPAAENDEGRDIYYMVSTTMHLSPGAPIMKSYDLVNWEIVNYVFDRAGIGDSFSLRNGQNSYGQGQWASSLRYHKGKFYVAFNTNNLGGSYIYSTDDIENGAWSRIAMGRAFHDPSLFFDDANGGTPYIFYGSGTTSAVKLNDDLTQVVAEYPNILRTSDYPGASYIGGLFEGAQVSYIDGYYYIVIITWPSGQGRQVALFRSPDLLGRYQSADGSNSYVGKGVLNSNGFAQGSLVPISRDGGRTDWYGFFFRDNFPIGRTPALIPATWQDGWPTFGTNGVVPVNGAFPKPIALTPAQEVLERQKSVVASDDFDNDAPHKAYMDEQWTVPTGPNYDQSLLGVELLGNGTFETGQLAPWAVQYSATLAVQDNADVGSKVLSVSARQNNGSGPGQDLTGKIQPGVTYKVSFKVRYDEGPATKGFIPAFSWGGSVRNMASVTVNKGQWTTVNATYTVPSDATWSSIKFVVETPWASGQTAADQVSYLIDDVSLIGQPITTEQPNQAEVTPNGSRLDMAWEWNHAPDNRYWSLTDRDGWLRLTTGKVVTGNYLFTKLSTRNELTWFEEARNTLSQRVFGPKGSAETRLDISGMHDGDVAGLAAYNRGFSYVAVKRVNGQNTIGVVNRVAPFAVTFDQATVESFVAGSTAALGDASNVWVKADTELNAPAGQLWTTFYYSLDGSTWTKLGGRVGPQTLDGSLAHFMGHRFGLFNYATQSTGGRVDFDYYALSNTLTADNVPITTDEIDAAIGQAQALHSGDYPAAAWADLQAALAKAVAARAAGFSTHNQVDAPTRALQRQLAELAVLREPAQPELDVTAVAGGRCVAGKAMPTVTVTNNEDVPVGVTVTSGTTTKTFPAVAPDRNAFHAFTARTASVPAGTVTVRAAATIDGKSVAVTEEVPYAAIDCG